ncbi:hypothetical protein FKM82_027648 [Ascaphus truei]
MKSICKLRNGPWGHVTFPGPTGTCFPMLCNWQMWHAAQKSFILGPMCGANQSFLMDNNIPSPCMCDKPCDMRMMYGSKEGGKTGFSSGPPNHNSPFC